MRRFCSWVFVFFLVAAYVESALPEPYDKAELLPFDEHGWFSNGSKLAGLITRYNVKTVIEIGCWLGLSTRFIASHLPKEGKLYAVDHWLGSEEHQSDHPAYQSRIYRLYELFLSNVIHAGLTDKIIPLRMTSLEATDYLLKLQEPVVPDLIYVDASHDTASVYADLTAWYPYVQSHGILCGDDWAWDSVRRAVTRFATERHLKVKARDNFWRLVE